MTRRERLDQIEHAINEALDEIQALRESHAEDPSSAEFAAAEAELRRTLYGVQLAVDQLDARYPEQQQ
ncbi:hypothetical protein [Kribbella sp. DT2]|uniref:hypothetical protein n=1 Tax=Kribbella sp. DT2 TaxID=3393427 RepID=UPI003CEB43AA